MKQKKPISIKSSDLTLNERPLTKARRKNAVDTIPISVLIDVNFKNLFFHSARIFITQILLLRLIFSLQSSMPFCRILSFLLSIFCSSFICHRRKDGPFELMLKFCTLFLFLSPHFFNLISCLRACALQFCVHTKIDLHKHYLSSSKFFQTECFFASGK